MADSALVHYSGDFAFYNGDIAEGAKLYVYDAGTSNLASVYQDAGLATASANPVTADSNGLLPFVFIGVQDYKVRLTTSDDTLIDEQDNLPGALDLAPFQAGQFASPSTAFTTRTSDYSMQESDIGGAIAANPTGGSFEIELMSAVTVGNGKGVIIDHVGTSNAVTIITSSSQTISFLGAQQERIVLPAFGASVNLVSDGANWHVTGDVRGIYASMGVGGAIKIVDRVSSAPSEPAVGALYIVAEAFGDFSQHQIIESTGDSEWNAYTPPSDCGWIAYVQDEDTYYRFIGSAWVSEAASDTVRGTIEIATAAEVKAASSEALAVTPGRQQAHPAHVKIWGNIDCVGTISLLQEYGISSVDDDGTGKFGVNLDTAFAAATYGCLFSARDTHSTTGAMYAAVPSSTAGSKGTSGCDVWANGFHNARAEDDPEELYVAFLGEQ